MKKKLFLVIIGLLIGGGTAFYIFNKKEAEKPEPQFEPLKEITQNYETFLINNYQEYLSYQNEINELIIPDKLSEETVKKDLENGYSLVYVTLTVNSCGETIEIQETAIENSTIKIYINDILSCGVCAPEKITYENLVKKENQKIDKIEPYIATTKIEKCDQNIAYKPIIYIYPEEETDLIITLNNPEVLTHTYPKYTNKWRLHVNKNDNIGFVQK